MVNQLSLLRIFDANFIGVFPLCTVPCALSSGENAREYHVFILLISTYGFRPQLRRQTIERLTFHFAFTAEAITITIQ
ncbi:Uncharacterised protein [Vibrio cholerae]|uniref:Uncharacterized protein n=1 Tax=Vibrio cholerae TaxID=666 RepID=A0A655RG33_VIBCL|nr:Uncharacterised protein [Vibrio cholerae]CSB72370.1 Uncharacterised protein [Vibrio cholerae]CSC12491.1 Uncharacterised protein [Vibrio cholerae]CSD08311.1 Uncharacterised protein [Vibrio cholerae]CSI47482.1 Uncharacterised protein [Vibrio cholerae]